MSFAVVVVFVCFGFLYFLIGYEFMKYRCGLFSGWNLTCDGIIKLNDDEDSTLEKQKFPQMVVITCVSTPIQKFNLKTFCVLSVKKKR